MVSNDWKTNNSSLSIPYKPASGAQSPDYSLNGPNHKIKKHNYQNLSAIYAP